ncbi:MAG: hypothetical protein FJZ90_17740, partial [Chloroflexi bacterium]|nr:hypothetical protein [Chloroflexota bacterium]
MKTRQSRSSLRRGWLLLLIVATVLMPLHGLALSDDARYADLREAIRVVAEKGAAADPASKALVFLYNKEINRWALLGKITLDEYAANQRVFEEMNEGFIKEAARAARLEPRLQERKKDAPTHYNPGTDTDVLVERSAEDPITLDDIQQADAKYQELVRSDLAAKLGAKRDHLPPASERIDTDTDFMPVPDHTKDAEAFKEICEYINERGGTAYVRADAARVEAKLRPGEALPPLSVEETGEYVSEMQRLVHEKLMRALEYDKRRSDPTLTKEQREQLEADAQLARSQAAKYLQRLEFVCNVLAEQRGVEGFEAPPLISLIIKAINEQGRGPQTAPHARSLEYLGLPGLVEFVAGYVKVLARVAAEDAKEMDAVVQEIAEQIVQLTSAQPDRKDLDEELIERAVRAFLDETGDAEAAAAFEQRLREEVE